MTRRVSTGLIAAALTLAASCYSNPEDDDDLVVDADAGATAGDAAAAGGDSAVGDAAARSDASRPAGPNCSGITDIIQQLICSVGGGGLTGMADAGTPGGGFRIPTAAECRNPRDTLTQLLCGFTRPRDGGTNNPNPSRDAGRDARMPDPMPPRDAGTPVDASMPTPADAAAATDAGLPQDSGATDSAVDDSAVDAGSEADAAAQDSAVEDAAAEDAAAQDGGSDAEVDAAPPA
jgi:hypothetical protein